MSRASHEILHKLKHMISDIGNKYDKNVLLEKNVWMRMDKKLLKKGNKNQVTKLSEWSRTGSFMNKPDVGWIHPDGQLNPEAGICYGVRYIGCLEIKESMKSLDFDTRTTIARESINRVAEAAGLKTASRRKKIDRRLAKMMGDLPHMQFAGSNVNLTITTESINLMVMETGDTIADHPLHVVSFASGGDVDTLDFVSYVAKDPEHGRACHVLECGGGLAEDVVTTIGQAFELRYKQYLKKQPKAMQFPDRDDRPGFDEERWGNRDDYVNDNPDAMMLADEGAGLDSGLPEGGTYAQVKNVSERNESSEKLIEFADTYDNSATHGSKAEVNDSDLLNGTEYDNKGTEDNSGAAAFDAFDMEPFSVELPAPSKPPPTSSKKSKRGNETDLRENKEPAASNLEPAFEDWYHGDMVREKAECLLEFDGDFLVRKSLKSPGQFVLSGKQTGTVKHLLLVDPEGIVRTRDFIFDSVSHLINYHRQNNLPIITQGSELQLVRPIKTSIAAI